MLSMLECVSTAIMIYCTSLLAWVSHVCWASREAAHSWKLAVRWLYPALCAENLDVTDPGHAGVLTEALETLYALQVLPCGASVQVGFHAYLKCCSSTAAQLTAYALWCLRSKGAIQSARLANQASVASGAACYELVHEEGGTRFHDRMYKIILAILEVSGHCYLFALQEMFRPDSHLPCNTALALQLLSNVSPVKRQHSISKSKLGLMLYATGHSLHPALQQCITCYNHEY